MKLLLNNKLFEEGINRVCINNNKCAFVSYNEKKIDLPLELDKLGFNWEHIAYSINDGRDIAFWFDMANDSISVCDEDEISNKVYAFMYTSCIYESAYSTISLHKTKRAAFRAMNKFLNETWYKEYDDYLLHGKGFDRRDMKAYPKLTKPTFKVGISEGWFVNELKIE